MSPPADRHRPAVTTSWPEAVSAVLRQYATFDGRARRSELWSFVVFQQVLVLGTWSVALVLLAVGIASPHVGYLPALWWWLVGLVTGWALLVPSYAVAARRLHDTGRSATLLALVLVPYAGFFLYYLWSLDGTPGPNAFGPDPKGRPAPLPLWRAVPPWGPPVPYLQVAHHPACTTAPG